MTTVIEEIEDHFVFNNVDRLQEQIKLIEQDTQFIESGIKESGDYGLNTLYRIDLISKTLRKKLNSIDIYLLDKDNLDQIDSLINELLDKLENHREALTRENELNSLNNKAENIVHYMAYIPIIVDEDSISDIKDTATNFRKSLAQQQHYFSVSLEELKSEEGTLKENINNLERKLGELDQKSTDIEDKLENQFSSFQNRFQESQEERSNEFMKQKEDIIQKHQDLLIEQKNDFSSQMNNMQDEFRKSMDDYNNEQEDLINKQKNRFDEFMKARNQEKAEYDRRLEEHKESVENLVGTISTNSIGGHYKNLADNHSTKATLWRVFTVISFISTITIGYILFVKLGPNLDWPSFFGKLAITSAVGSLTAYSSTQAAKHHEEEKKNRGMEVELKTLNPYIASFTPKEQKRLKEILFPMIFGGNSNEDKQESVIEDEEEYQE